MAPLSKSLIVTLIVCLDTVAVSSARRLHGNRFIQPEELSAQRETEEIIVEDEEPPATLPNEGGSLIAQQFTPDPFGSRDRMDMIKSGELGLAGLRYMPSSFSNNNAGGDVYTEVYGEFCAFDSSLNKANPSFYSTHKDIQAESVHCGEHRYSVSLHEVMAAIEQDGSSNVKTLPLEGMLFHQGYSGAGLISNALTAFDSTLVVSEHDALADALAACDVIRNRFLSEDCSSTKQQALIRDVITLLSRTSDGTMSHLFLKLHSSSAAYLPTLRALYPDAKWTFSYRDAEETLEKSMQRYRNTVCKKAKRNPTSALVDMSTEHQLDLEHLSHHEVCALHLSTLSGNAIQEHESSDTGMLVSYDDVVSTQGQVVIDDILPYLGLQGEMTPEIKVKITDILSRRSNTNSKLEGEVWDVSNEKKMEVSEDVHNAVKTFMGGLMGDSR